jgi:Vitamin K-dependent gamma-carboxylase
MIKKHESFFLREASPLPLGIFRIGLASILLLQVGMCHSQFFEFFGTQGILQNQIGERFSRDGMFQTTELVRTVSRYGISENRMLFFLGVTYIGALITFLFGLFTRLSSLIAWGLHFLLAEGHFTGYGVDLYSHVALFYSIWMPMGSAYSVDNLIFHRTPKDTWWAGLSSRVWQLHLSIAYVATGLEKLRGEQWRNGEAVWRAMMLPLFRRYDLSWLASFPLLVLLLAWGTLLIEVGYPFLIFPKRTRTLWVGMVVALHLGIGIFLGLHLFALLMALLTVCFFGLDIKKNNETARVTSENESRSETNRNWIQSSQI